MSCGRIALERAGIKVDNYFASEINKQAITISEKNYPDIVQVGDICELDVATLPKIDLVMGGSPCQDLSGILGREGKGLEGEKSKLFWQFVRVLRETEAPLFLLENVMMKQENQDAISEILGVESIKINSKIFSAQSRPRLYWTNIPQETMPKFDHPSVIDDILEDNVPEKLFYKKELTLHDKGTVAATLEVNTHDMLRRVYRTTSKCPTLTVVQGGYQEKKVLINGRARKLSPVEYERLQTVPDNYTEGVGDTHRRSMLGNGWTVDVIAHLFTNL